MSVQECRELARRYFGSDDVTIRYREELVLSESKDRLLEMRVWATAVHHPPGNPSVRVSPGSSVACSHIEPATHVCSEPMVLGIGHHLRKDLEPKALELLAAAIRDAIAQRDATPPDAA